MTELSKTMRGVAVVLCVALAACSKADDTPDQPGGVRATLNKLLDDNAQSSLEKFYQAKNKAGHVQVLIPKKFIVQQTIDKKEDCVTYTIWNGKEARWWDVIPLIGTYVSDERTYCRDAKKTGVNANRESPAIRLG